MRTASIAGLGFVSAFLIVVACSTANMTTYAPVDEKTKYGEDVLFRAARNAAEGLGFQVNASENATSFDTREKEVATSSIPRLSYKYAFHVDTAGGVLAISSTCSKNSTMSESEYKDCGDDRPDRVVKMQAALRKEILERAVKAQDREPDFGHFGEVETPDAGKAPAKDDSKTASDKSASDDKASDDKASDDKKSESKDDSDKDTSKSKSKKSAKKK